MSTLIRFAPDRRTLGASASDFAACLRAIRSEYRELPRLALTRPQVVRLWNLAPRLADGLLSELVAAGFLCCDAAGRYVRAERWAH